MHSFYFLVCFFVLFYTFNNIYAADEATKPKVKKDPLDFTENDVNKLFEEWEVIFRFLIE